MNPNRILMALAVALGLINPITAVIVTVEDVPNSEPVMLALFVLPWLVGAELVRRGRLTAGSIVLGLLSLVNVISFAGWTRTSALDWTVQSLAAAGGLACLAVAVSVLMQRHRAATPAGAVR
jgi:hypothetical protein